MENIERIYRDTKAVKLLASYANGATLEASEKDGLNRMIKDLASVPTPHNRYLLAQLIGFAVNELLKPELNWLDVVADVKMVGLNEKASFKIRSGEIKAVIQAKNGTTERSRVVAGKVELETVEVSARPTVNLSSLQAGLVDAASLVKDAKEKISAKINAYVEGLVLASAKKYNSDKLYATGAGVVKATFDPMVRHWMRYGGATIMGDLEVISKLSELTGFTAATTTKQFSNDIITEHNTNGFIGKYLGADVRAMTNPYLAGGQETAMNRGLIYIVPNSPDKDARALKVLLEGDLQSMEASNIDDKSFEIRLDQYVGAGLLATDTPTLGIYEDSSVK